jgi:hypothetical protein
MDYFATMRTAVAKAEKHAIDVVGCDSNAQESMVGEEDGLKS